MEKNGIYKVRWRIYDTSSDEVYVIKILSDRILDFSDNSSYYNASLISSNGIIHDFSVKFYPDDWLSIEKLSSLEIELL